MKTEASHASQLPEISPIVAAAGAALAHGQIAQAEALLRSRLRHTATDVEAMRLLAEVADRLERNADAERLLERCLALEPGFQAARYQYTLLLLRLNKPTAALHHIEWLVISEPQNISYLILKASHLAKVGEHAQSVGIYADVLAAQPQLPRVWLGYGHGLAAVGRVQDSVAAYRTSIRLSPSLGEAYWSLANLKTYRFQTAEKDAIRAALAREDLREHDRIHFEFAMGKAYEDDAEYSCSFAHYARANAMRRSRSNYSADDMRGFVDQSKQLFSADFFAHRQGFGNLAAEPIFIVGMPRAGSTLIEQILASHSQVEATMELPDMIMMAGALAASAGEARYPGVLARLTADDCQALGQQYLDQTRVQRKTSKPVFIDKTPHNFLHIGLIRLVLPNAKIIDVRRHPMACCFSGFKQQFADGHRYTYSLEDIGRYYRDYIELMDHFERVIPGKPHRLLYENLIDDPEQQIAELLSVCGLAFEGQCLRFYESDRGISTPSAQQVRKPLYRDAADHWRHFEQWLQPLKTALGDVLDAYPRTPRG